MLANLYRIAQDANGPILIGDLVTMIALGIGVRYPFNCLTPSRGI